MSDICGSQAAARSMQQLAREFSACRDMLVALGNENRQLIFVALLEHPGGVRVGDLAKLARLSRPATSHHLKVLQDAGLIDHYQQGTKNYYHASARLDRWAQLARVTAHAEQFVRLVQELDARAEAGKHACSESGSDLMSLLAARHSVRSFTDRPIEEGAVEQLQAEADALNERLGLSIQLCLDNPEAFDGRLAHYGSFRNVRNHIALVGPTRPGLDKACGYAGERLVLLAQELGLNTCWVALTYSKKASAARVAAGEKFVCCIALGYGEKAGAAHQVKPIEKLGRTATGSELATAPAWFAAGLEAAQLAPTAVNQQRFRFELAANEHAVHARVLPAVSCGHIDLGIAKLHFELGANSVSRDWSFA